jgi:DNA-binding response OmpR family regulator
VRNRILIVDNDLDLVDHMRRVLADEGYHVIMADDGLSGMRAFYNGTPDLVILNSELPKLNGFEVCQRIRDMAATPIIMLLAHGHDEGNITGPGLGVNDLLTKPVPADELLTRIRATFRRSRLEQANIG